MKNAFYSRDELERLGFKSIGTNVLISRFANFYSPENMMIGDNVRIDDFCVLSGIVKLGSNIHISAHCLLYGSNEIVLKNFSGLSPRTIIFSASDDFGGDYLISPMVPKEFTNVKGGPVIVEKYCQLGAGTIVFPNCHIGEGSVTGAMSLVNKDLDAWSIYVGVPVYKLRKRGKRLIKLSKSYEQQREQGEAQ